MPLVFDAAVVSGLAAKAEVPPHVVAPPGGMPERGKSSPSTECSPGGPCPARMVVQAVVSSCVALPPFGRPGQEALSRGLSRRPMKAHSREKACGGSLLQEALESARSLERPE